MKEVKGNLIELALNGRFDVIVHGCNCFCNMNMGIAKAIKEHFLAAYEADLKTRKGDKSKLGSISWGREEVCGHELIIVNAYTQFNYWGKGRKVDYEAIRKCFREIKLTFPNKTVGFPKIGSGYGGGDWNIISVIIVEEFGAQSDLLSVVTI